MLFKDIEIYAVRSKLPMADKNALDKTNMRDSVACTFQKINWQVQEY